MTAARKICMFQFESTTQMNTLAQQMLLQSAKLDQKSDLPSNASQANMAFHALCTNSTQNSYTKNDLAPLCQSRCSS